jgi:hypothetical protein
MRRAAAVKWPHAFQQYQHCTTNQPTDAARISSFSNVRPIYRLKFNRTISAI